MNWVDVAIVAVLTLFALQGFGRPFFDELLELSGFITAFFLSLKFYNLTALKLKDFFSLPHSLANVLGFILVWYVIEIIFFLFAKSIYRGFRKSLHLPGEEFFSILPAFLRGLIFVAIILVLIGTFPIQPQIKKEIGNSKIGSWILAQTYQLEGPLKNVFGGIASDTLTFLTIQPKTSEKVNLGFQNSSFFFDERMEFTMIDLVNNERLKRNLPSLTFDSQLRQVARGHSADMFERGYFSHFTPEGYDLSDRAVAQGVQFLVIGENLAYAPSLELAHQGLMNSPGHRANILSGDYHKIGIGIANGVEYGLMITQVFKD